MKKRYLDLSVLIVDYNNPNDTIETIDSLRQSTVDFNIVLVENGSTNENIQKIKKRFNNIDYVINKENLGFAGGNNSGLKHIMENPTRYILLINNDMAVAPNCVEILYNFAEKSSEIIAAPLIYYFQSNDAWYAGGKIDCWRLGASQSYEDLPLSKDPIETSFSSGGCFIIRTDIFSNLKGFDEKYFAYNEDTDLSVRISQLGYKQWLIPKAKVWHKVNRTLGSRSPLQTYYDTRNKLFFMKKFGKWYHYPTFLTYLFIKNGLWNIVGSIVKPAPIKKRRVRAFFLALNDFAKGRMGKCSYEL